MIFDDLWMHSIWGKGFDLRMKHGEFPLPSLGTEGFLGVGLPHTSPQNPLKRLDQHFDGEKGWRAYPLCKNNNVAPQKWPIAIAKPPSTPLFWYTLLFCEQM
jgi:hypothetical protein